MTQSSPPGPLGKLIGFFAMVVLVVLGLMFSAVVLAIASVIGLGVFGYFWWKTRALRKAMKEHAATHAPVETPIQGNIIEGEAVVIGEGEEIRRSLLIVEDQAKSH
jgi:hypothetical protein